MIDARPHEVWKAITAPTRLERWLCDTAETSLELGDRFQLTSSIPHVTGYHNVRAALRDELLTLTWRVGGLPTKVECRLFPLPDGTRLELTHWTEKDLPRKADADGSDGAAMMYLHNIWHYALDLLKEYVEEGEANCRLLPQENPLETDWALKIKATPEAIFQALVDPSEIPSWNPHCQSAVVQPEPGGRYSWGWEGEESESEGPDKILEIEAPHRLVYSWFSKPYPLTRVSWDIEACPDGARVRLRHQGFDSPSKRLNEWKLGWSWFLHALKWKFQQSRPLAELAGLTE